MRGTVDYMTGGCPPSGRGAGNSQTCRLLWAITRGPTFLVYYALADAFTICDQYFSSSLTGTTPNRLYLWTGTIRAKPTAASSALVYNEDVDHDHMASWTTFPERLENLGISWKIYQNELTIESGLSGEEDAWLANFGDNPIEYFSQFHVRLSANYRKFLDNRVKELPGEIAALRKQLANPGPASRNTVR